MTSLRSPSCAAIKRGFTARFRKLHHTFRAASRRPTVGVGFSRLGRRATFLIPFHRHQPSTIRSRRRKRPCGANPQRVVETRAVGHLQCITQIVSACHTPLSYPPIHYRPHPFAFPAFTPPLPFRLNLGIHIQIPIRSKGAKPSSLESIVTSKQALCSIASAAYAQSGWDVFCGIP
ncbi:hypothetical protein C8R45DRAFT_401713 [Mycena sanguinolenta]|nr:hypothetical protein C8R45DRAFT_401713 [Mycena sanguinolenta]